MTAGKIYFLIGGPLDGQAFRSRSPLRGIKTVNLHPSLFVDGERWGDQEAEDELYRRGLTDYLYEVVRLPQAKELGVMIPREAMVHQTVPKADLAWRSFMMAMRCLAVETLS